MAGAGYWALRLGYADHLAQSDSADQVQSALQIAPGNAAYWMHWIDLTEAAGQSASAGIEKAAGIDPYNATVWIRAGLEAEGNGDLSRGEQDLLRAARQSRQFEPRWILANYYFRRHDEEHFWPWTKSALTWSHGDRRLLFELCWAMRPDADTILNRAIPDDPKVWRDYLKFLVHNKQAEAALVIAKKLGEQASLEDRSLLLGYTDHLLDERCWQDALSVWNALCSRKVVPYSAIDTAKGSLINGDLTSEPLNAGLDWHLPKVDGVLPVYSPSSPWLRFDFSKNQPEHCSLIYQFVPVTAGSYRLRFEYRTEGIAPQSGLQWKIIDAQTRSDLPTQPLSLASEQWSKGEATAVVPAGGQMARVTLVYQRPPGTVHIEGSVWLRNLSWERLP